MAKLQRIAQRLFGSTASTGQIGKFGSLAAGTPVTTTDPSVVQALPNFLNGWYDAVIGNNSPTIQDMNGLHFLFSYIQNYFEQAGIPEWHSETTYYFGSLVNDGNGYIYKSIINNNLNSPISTAGSWIQVSGVTINTPVTPTITVPTGQSFTNPLLSIPSTGIYLVSSGAGLYSFDILIIQSGGLLTVNTDGVARVI